MRVYELLDSNNYYGYENIDQANFETLKDVVAIYISTLGSFGRGGLIYLLTSKGEEILFDYFSSERNGNIVSLKESPVWEKVKENFPVLKLFPEIHLEKGWHLVSQQVGWFFWIKDEYKKQLYEKCEQFAKESPMYQPMLQSGETLESIMNEFILPQIGPEIIYEMLKQ